jgi:hypothetical protein
MASERSGGRQTRRAAAAAAAAAGAPGEALPAHPQPPLMATVARLDALAAGRTGRLLQRTSGSEPLFPFGLPLRALAEPALAAAGSFWQPALSLDSVCAGLQAPPFVLKKSASSKRLAARLKGGAAELPLQAEASSEALHLEAPMTLQQQQAVQEIEALLAARGSAAAAGGSAGGSAEGSAGAGAGASAGAAQGAAQGATQAQPLQSAATGA